MNENESSQNRIKSQDEEWEKSNYCEFIMRTRWECRINLVLADETSIGPTALQQGVLTTHRKMSEMNVTSALGYFFNGKTARLPT